MVTAIIVAAGKGSRMNVGYNKQYIKIKEKEILTYTLEIFERNKKVDNIILVAHENEVDFCEKQIVEKYNILKVIKVVSGGRTRQESVYKGLKECKDSDLIIIHDGARPFLKSDYIDKCINVALEKQSAVLAVKVKDTIKTGENGVFINTLKRDNLYSVQTPQVFKYDLIIKAHKKAIENDLIATDDASLIEDLGHKVNIVEGDYFNIKVTTKEDIFLGESIINYMEGDNI